MRTRHFALVLLSIGAAQAQDRAAIVGTITDPSGSSVEGATVQLDSPASGLHRQTASGSRGIYEFQSLPVGAYKVSVSAAGFKPCVVRDIELLFGQVRTTDVRLEIGTASESVDVTAASDAL